jgi:hypothetical protein
MKASYFLVFLFLLFLHLSSYSQSYLGYSTQNTELIDSVYNTIRTVGKGDALFIISLEAQHGHYNVIHIKSNKEGFIPRKNVVLERVVPQTEDNIFSSIKKSEVKDPIIKIHNASKLALTIKLNNTLYEVNPKDRTTIHLKAGKYYFRVSNPDIAPYYGTEDLDEYKLYEWEFYIGDM